MTRTYKFKKEYSGNKPWQNGGKDRAPNSVDLNANLRFGNLRKSAAKEKVKGRKIERAKQKQKFIKELTT